MAIDYTGSKAPKELSPQDAVAKALENLQKFSGPIFQQAVKSGGWGSTKSTESFDGAKAYAAEQDQASFLDKLLGAAQGAMAGMQAGQAFTSGGSESSQKTGTVLGAIAGAASGIGGYSHGFRAGSHNLEALGQVAQSAAMFEQQQRQRQAEEAVATMSRGLAELGSATDPKTAAMNAKMKRQMVNDAAQKLMEAGVAPDKAISTSRAIAAIHDPSSEFAPAGQRAAAAWAEFSAIPPGSRTKADKDRFLAVINSAALEENIRSGKLPSNLGAILGGGGGMSQPMSQPGAGPAPAPGGAPGAPGSMPAPSGMGPGGIPLSGAAPGGPQPAKRSMMDIMGNPLNVGGIPGFGIPGAGGGGAVAAPAPTPSEAPAMAAPSTSQSLVIPNKAANAQEAKQAFGAQNAWKVLDQAEALLMRDIMPDNPIEAAQANFSSNGLDMGMIGGAIGAGLGGITGSAAGGVGSVGGVLLGKEVGSSIGKSIGKVGQGASWGMSSKKEMGLNEASQLRAQLQTHLGQMLGSNSAGRSEDMKDIINAALGIQSDSLEERLAAIKSLREMVQANANEIGAFSEEKAGRLAAPRVPGVFYFD